MENNFDTVKAICEEYCEDLECEPYTESISVKVKRKYFSELYNRVQNLNYVCQSISLQSGQNSIVDALFLYLDLSEFDMFDGDDKEDWWKKDK